MATSKQQKTAASINRQIPHHALLYTMIAQAAVMLPHIQASFTWLPVLALICAVWRWLIYLGKYPFPSWQLKLAISAVGSLLILATVATTHSLETWSSFLILTFSLKLLESKTRRDMYVIIFLAYFLLAVNFIYSQSILLTLYQVIAFVLITSALISMHLSYAQNNVFHPVKLASKMTLQVIPLMVILFIIFPRLPPFWSLPSASSARTGLSEEMSPGDIASLTKSDEIAFRAIFSQRRPDNDQLYWRGLVFSNFYQGTWSLGDFPLFKQAQAIDWNPKAKEKALEPDTASYFYQVLQEPSNQIWRFGLDLAIPQQNDTGLTWDFRVVGKKNVSSLTSYQIKSFPNVTLDPVLPTWLRQRETRIPANDNPRAVSFARTLYDNSATDDEFIQKLLNHIRRNNFSYTLEPPTLDKLNSIDEFWFESQSGFCMHYAGALTYMLRAVDIPARVIGGYQGGDINPVTGHTVVRQYHAHAWVEAWLPTKGWQRFDPTAVIAPERVNQGLEAALSASERSSLSAFTNARLNNTLFSARMLHLLESIEHRWNLAVVGYDAEDQTDLLKRWLGEITPLRIALLLFTGMLLSFAFAGLTILFRNRHQSEHPAINLLKKFMLQMHKHDFIKDNSESPMSFVRRISTEKGVSTEIYQPLSSRLEQLLYQQEPIEKDDIKELKMFFNRLKAALKT